MDSIILHGAGGHAKVVLDSLKVAGFRVVALFDPRFPDGTLGEIPLLGVYDATFAPHARALVAIGDNGIRKQVAQITRHQFGKIVHPSAVISEHSTVGEGSMILHRAIVQTGCEIGVHVIVNTGAQVDHDCNVGAFVHLAPGSILCGNVTVEEGAMVGAGAVVLPGKRIGSWATVGAGAIVTQDVPARATVAGNPARILNRTTR